MERLLTAKRYSRLNEKISASLRDRSKSDALLRCMKRGRDRRSRRLETLPGGVSFRDDVRKAKKRCIEELPGFKKQFIENVEKCGAEVALTKPVDTLVWAALSN